MSQFSFLQNVMNNSKKPKDSDGLELAIDIEIGNLHHIGSRESQQDSFGVSDIFNNALCYEKGVLAIVADGMGGLQSGAEISALITAYFLEEFSNTPCIENPFHELANLTSQAHIRACSYLTTNNISRGGSTMVSALIRDNKLYFVSVGDSRICLIRGGEMIQLNREHTYGAELDQKAIKGEISFEKAYLGTQRSALTSYMGTADDFMVDIPQNPIPLIQGDKLLIMSDGVFGTLDEDEIVLACEASAFKAALQMEEDILLKDKSSQDNFTAIIIEYKQ